MSRRPCTVTGCPNTTRRGSGRCPEHRYADRGDRERPSPPAEATSRAAAAGSALRAAFGDEVRIETTAFVSGAVALVLRNGSSVASVLGSAAGDGWGVSVETEERMSGHVVVASVDDVVDVVRAHWPPHAGRQSRHGR